MAERSDRHVHDRTGRPPIELFLEQEQAALIPLPSHPYDSSQVELRVCRMDGFVEFSTNFYSVPFDHVADILALKITDHEVSVYSPELDLVACHERVPDGSAKICEKAEHRGSAKVRYGLEPVREAFMALGESAGPFLAGLQLKQPRNCGFHARIILAMKATYHPDDINKALRHAATYYAFDGKAVERILSANASPRSLESYRNEKARERLEKELPRVRQRSLNEYNDLIKEPSS
jgi:hypothetical protein